MSVRPALACMAVSKAPKSKTIASRPTSSQLEKLPSRLLSRDRVSRHFRAARTTQSDFVSPRMPRGRQLADSSSLRLPRRRRRVSAVHGLATRPCAGLPSRGQEAAGLHASASYCRTAKLNCAGKPAVRRATHVRCPPGTSRRLDAFTSFLRTQKVGQLLGMSNCEL